MKKLTYLATLAGGLLLATSCVDLDQEPQSFITEEDYIANMDQSALESAVTALYRDLWGSNYGFNCRVQRIQVCADEIVHRAAKAGNELANYDRLSPSISANTADFDQSWAFFYTTIANANKLINNAKVPEGATAEETTKFNATLGEAYFLRGLCYFYLVRMYGDVPLVMSQDDAATNMPRISVQEIYDTAIVPSMTTAVELLPDEPRAGNSSTPTKWAAETCLADIYITMAGWPLNRGQEYYTLAANAAKDVLDNNHYHQLEDNYSDLWMESNKNSSEFMFCLHHSSSSNSMASNYGKSYYPADYDGQGSDTGWADYYARAEKFNEYPNDERKEWNFMTEWPSTSTNPAGQTIQWQDSPDGLPAISKYYNYDHGRPGQRAQADGVTSIYRLPDAMLLYAEASTRATGSVDNQALEAVQDIQRRAKYEGRGIALTTTTDPQAFLEAVSDERSYEFFAEMRRWFELVRTEQVSVKHSEYWSNSLFNANGHYYFPIPSQQILLTGWTNNAGY